MTNIPGHLPEWVADQGTKTEELLLAMAQAVEEHTEATREPRRVTLEHPVRTGFLTALGAMLLPVFLGVLAAIAFIVLTTGPAGAQEDRNLSGATQPCPEQLFLFPEGTRCGEGGGYVTPSGQPAEVVTLQDDMRAYEQANNVDTVPLGSDEKCPEGYIMLASAPICAQESTTQPGRVAGFEDASVSASPAPAASQYQYGEASASVEPTAPSQALPETGGPLPWLPVAGGVLLIAGGLLARRLAR